MILMHTESQEPPLLAWENYINISYLTLSQLDENVFFFFLILYCNTTKDLNGFILKLLLQNIKKKVFLI